MGWRLKARGGTSQVTLRDRGGVRRDTALPQASPLPQQPESHIFAPARQASPIKDQLDIKMQLLCQTTSVIPVVNDLATDERLS